jgi:DNA helicase-2/ATP-dependent DNA helicase PcrA
MNEGVFPSRKVNTLPGMEEERRLAFVAMTRAEKRLFLSEAEGRNLDGSPRYPSRFILDIDEGLIEPTSPPEERLVKDARTYIEMNTKYLPEKDAADTFAIGQRVKQEIFGAGTILDIDKAKRAHIIQFEGMETPRAISFRAKLEVLTQ